MRLNKFVAHCGIGSRRACDVLIKEGRVTVNGKIVTEPGKRIKTADLVKFEGKTIRPQKKQIYILINKPKNYITTTADERGRKTVMDIIGDKVKERIYPVGRLDRNTTGLLLMTNDGDLAKKLSHPSYGVAKVYHATLDKNLSSKEMDTLREGIKIDDKEVNISWISYVSKENNSEIGLEIHEGRNRIVRRLFEELGFKVLKLDRVYYAGLTKKDLSRGRFRHLSEKEVIMLQHFSRSSK